MKKIFKLIILTIIGMCPKNEYGMKKNCENQLETAYADSSKLIAWAKENKRDLKKLLARTDEENCTLLHYASQMLNYAEVKLLLENGADVNLKGGIHKNTLPINLAIQGLWKEPEKARDVIKILCLHNSDVDFDMTYRLMQIRMYCPENEEIISECLDILDRQKTTQPRLLANRTTQ